MYYVIGQLLIVIPMLWLEYCGQPRRILDYPSSLGGWHSISSAGHLLSVAAVISFFIMIYDSVRQAKPTIRNNFGVGRFNTRLNFYFFEISRLFFIQRKNFYNYRFKSLTKTSHMRHINYLELLYFDTTLFSYQFFTK
jgi:heme/copper-type cytochrome/quinol oxidase subunit 1